MLDGRKLIGVNEERYYWCTKSGEMSNGGVETCHIRLCHTPAVLRRGVVARHKMPFTKPQQQRLVLCNHTPL